MRFAQVAVLLLCCIAGPLAAGPPLPKVYLQGEYRMDALDYESTESEFYRLKTSLIFSGKSSFNATAVYLEKTGEERHTWSLVLGDISPSFSFILGNFNAGFGSGLLLGHRTGYNPDAFSFKEPAGIDKTFTPVKSGNPAYAFNGFGITFGRRFENFFIALDVFYSMNERYIDEKGYFSGLSGNTLGTIENSRSRDYAHSEPVIITATGGMISCFALETFLVQASWFRTGIGSPAGESILWDVENTGETMQGTSGLDGAGLLAQYSDRYIRIFCESAVSRTNLECENGPRRTVTGQAILSGIRYSTRLISLSLTGKEIGPGFFTPYGSSIGEDHPGSACFLGAEYRPSSYFSAGASSSSEKRQVPAAGDSELPHTYREGLHVQFSGTRLTSARFSIRRVTKNADGNMLRKTQYAHADRIEITRNTRLDFSALYQTASDTKESAFVAAGVNCRFFNIFLISFYYCKAGIGAGNPVYAVISPVEKSSIPGMSFSESSDTVIFKTGIKHEDMSFSFRYLQQFSGGASYRRRVEFSGSAYF